MTEYNFYRPQMPPVVKNIIIINVVMMAVTMITKTFMYQYFSLFYFTSPFFHPYQFISYMFMHGGFFHIVFNMLGLYMFGSVLERIWGSRKFFTYYMACGIGAALCNELAMYLQILSDPLVETRMMNVPTVGASGAIYGLLLAYGMLFPNERIMLLFPPIPMKAKWFVVVFGIIELGSGLASGITGSSVAHFAHLGGMIFGYLILSIWKKKNNLYS